jgi:hypothetical protein
VEQYTAKFRLYAPRTKLGDEALHKHYYDHLMETMKDALASSDRDFESNLETCIKAANALDLCHQCQAAEKNPKANIMPLVTAEVVHPVSIPNPMAIDVDATINAVKKVNVTNWVCFMKGRCYGCGSREHQKKDGGHECDVCNHCSKVGY